MLDDDDDDALDAVHFNSRLSAEFDSKRRFAVLRPIPHIAMSHSHQPKGEGGDDGNIVFGIVATYTGCG